MFFFNGQDFRKIIRVEKVERPVFPTVNNLIRDKLVDNGADFIRSRREPLYIKVIFNYVQNDLNKIRRLLSLLLYTRDLQMLYFYDEAEIIYYAKVDKDIELKENNKGFAKGSITFIVPDGVGYAREPKEIYKQNVTSLMIENKGTELVYPVFDFTVHGGELSMIAISNSHGSFQFGDALENAPTKKVTISGAQASSTFKTKGTLTILNEAIRTSQGWIKTTASQFFPYSDFDAKVSNITSSQMAKVPTGNAIKVAMHAQYWQTGERIADWVKGKTFKFDKIKDVNQSRSKKAYRLLDDEGYLGWLVEQDIEGFQEGIGTALEGVYPIFQTEPTGENTHTSLALKKPISNNPTNFDLVYKIYYKANKGEYGAMTVGVADADGNIIAGVRAETIRGDGQVDFVCFTNNLKGTREMGRIKADFTGTISISKNGADVSFSIYNETDKRTYGIKLSDSEIKDWVSSNVYIICSKEKGVPYLKKGYPLNIKFTGKDADVYVTSKDPETLVDKYIPSPRYKFSPGDVIRLDMRSGEAFQNGRKHLNPIAYGSKPVAISPGTEEVIVTVEGDNGASLDCNVIYREVYR